MCKIANISKHPFAQYSAEEEIDLEAIYYEQQYYQELLELTKNGVSRFILGQRGQGKSATIHHLIQDLKKSSILPILIRRYDDFPEKDNEPYYLYSIVQGITFAIAEYLYVNQKIIKNLTKTQKNEIGVLIEAFYDDRLADEFLENSKRIQHIRKINLWKKIWNYLGIKIANNTLATVTQITAQLIQSTTGTTPNFSISEGEYFKNLKYNEIRKLPKDEIVKWPKEYLVKIIQNLVTSSKAIGFNSIVILFDQIDEVRSINSDIEKVADFMVDFLSDTNFMYMKDLSVIISLWSEVKNKLNKKCIRFDKFKEIDIRWQNDELIKLMDKRLLFYSKDKSHPVTFGSLIPAKPYQELILTLAGGSPRALLTIMSYIMSEEQSELPIKEFSIDAINRGSMAFCKKFDYVSLQPSRTGKSNDLKSWITKILRMRIPTFTAKQYGDFYKLSSKTSSKNIDQMIKLNLIREALLPTEDAEPIYEVVDPRILHLISRGTTEIE